MGDKRRSPSPAAAPEDAASCSNSDAQRARRDSESDEVLHPPKRLHRDTSSSGTVVGASDTLPTAATTAATAKATAAYSQDSTVDMTEDTSSDTSMLASTQDISMEQCSDEHELAPATDAADDLAAIPQTPPPVSSHARGLQSPLSSRLGGSTGPSMQLDPSGSAKMFHAVSASSSSSSGSAAVSPLSPPSCPTVTFHARLPVLSEHERIFTPVQRDALGKLWRVIWYPHGQHLYDDVVSVFVEMGVDETAAPQPTGDALPTDDTSSSSSSTNSPSLDVAATGEAGASAAVATRSVRVEFVLLSQSGDAALHQRQISRVHTFSALSHEFGMSKLCSRKELLNPLNGFLTPDGCVDLEVHLHTVDGASSDDDDEPGDATSDALTPLRGARDVRTSPPLAAIDALGANAAATRDSGDMDATAQYLAYDSKTETGMVGLKNQGATCYMNSLLQTLFHLRAFRQVVYETPSEREDTHDSVSLALQRVFYRLQTKRSAVSTKELTRSFGWSQIDSFMQHDVQELYRILCDRLEEKMKHTNVDGAIKRLFEGQVRSFVQCVHVDFQSFRDESFYDLQLDVKGCKDIYASFRKYVETELLDGDNQYDAEGHGKQDAKKGVRFLRLPPVLNIQLKRFEYDPMRDGMVKIHDRFEFPKTLVLDDFLSPSDGDGTASGGDGDLDAAALRKTPQHVYHLHSVLVHSGDVHGGHYYVFIRPGKDIASSSNWYRFDDDQISIVDEQTAIEGNYGSVASAAAAAMDSRPSTPLYGGLPSSPDRDAFQSADVIPDDDRTDDVYDYSRSNGSGGDASGPSSNSLMLPLGRSFSSAYMLVYVRDGNNDIQSIAGSPAAAAAGASREISTDDGDAAATASEPVARAVSGDLPVPEPLVRRFLEEERAHARRKKMQQTEHLYMTVRIASDSSVASLQRITKTLDFSSFGNAACLRIRIKRAAPIAQLYARIYHKTGVPVRRQRLWKVITRENRTQRPDSLVDEDVVDCVERLIDDDASPKAPVKLFLQILNADELGETDNDGGDEESGANGLGRTPTATQTSVVRRHFWTEFTPPAAPSAGNGDDDDAKPDGDAMDIDGDEDDRAVAAAASDDDASALAMHPRVRVLQSPYDILLFIKWYDRTKALSERLEYMGNIVIDSRRTGAELAKYLHEALRIPFTRELVLFEEVQPQQVAEIEMDMRLEAAEIQHGDIICYQYADDDDDDDGVDADPADGVETATGGSAAALVARPRQQEKYPDVPQYFQYLLDRVEVVFRRHRRDGVVADGDETSDTFSLGLLYSNVYDDIVDAVAAHLGFDGAKRLHVRLYQHSPLSNQPKKNPLRHAKYAGNTHVTLDELLTEFTERTNVLYYEVLAHPITEIEAKRQVVVYFSIYEATPLFVDAAAPQTPRRAEFLVLPNATVSDLVAQIRDAYDVPHATALRVCEVSADGTRILQILGASASLDALSTSSGYSSSGEHAVLVEVIPADELLALRARDATDARGEHDDDDNDDGDDPVLRIGVVHFSFQTNTHVYIQTHGVPFVVHFRLSETVAQVKERIRKRIGVAEDEFQRWNFAAVKELRASVVAEVYDDMDAAAVESFPMARLEEWCGARFGDIGNLGLEHADPKPASAKPMPMMRRQEQGIRIRQN